MCKSAERLCLAGESRTPRSHDLALDLWELTCTIYSLQSACKTLHHSTCQWQVTRTHAQRVLCP